MRTKFHRIPIYDMRLWVGVADTVALLHQKFEWAFGKQEGQQIACVTYSGSKLAIFFERKEISHELIAHECFHATVRLLEHCSHYLGSHHEPHAYLCGYITELVYADLAAWKIPVRLRTVRLPEKWVQKNQSGKS